MRALSASVLLALAGLCPAQAPPDGWCITGFTGNGSLSGLWLLDAGRTTLVAPQPQTLEMRQATRVAADPAGCVWFGNYTIQQTALHVYEVGLAAGAVAFQRQLTALPLIYPIGGLVHHGGRLWFVLRTGQIGNLDPTTPMQTPVYVPALPVPSGQLANAIASDGRELFVATWEQNAGSAPTVFAFDTAALVPSWRAVANTRLGGPARASAICLGPDASLLVSDQDGRIRKVDPVNGGVTVAGQLQAIFNAGAYDPWSGLFCAANVVVELDFLDVASGTWLANPVPFTAPIVAGVAIVAEQPFLRFGRGCPGTTGEPRMAWDGLPVAGGTAHIALRDGTPGGAALLLLGFSNTTSALGPLPLAGSPFGAPGCDLLVSMDAIVAHTTPAGSASQALTLPNSPVTAGLVLHAQWLVSSTVNNLGLVASEGLTIRMR